MNEGNFTGTLIAIVTNEAVHIQVDRKQYSKIKKHVSDFCCNKQMCFRTTKIPCFVAANYRQFMIEIRLDKLDDSAEFASLEKVEVRYKMRRYFRRGRFPGVRAKLLSIEAI